MAFDWKNLVASENRWLTRHYTPGRAGNKIDKIVIHHNAGRLSVLDCYNVWQTREASAHYQVDVNGHIGQLVHDWDTAWHAGNGAANRTSIGIEHANSGGAPDWPISDATVENGAHLVAAICHKYGLGRPKWMVNVFPHYHFSATACPAQLARGLNSRYMSRAQAWYDAMAQGASAPATPVPAPATPRTNYNPNGYDAAYIKTVQELLVSAGVSIGPSGVDGIMGADTFNGVKVFQKSKGLEVDGIPGPNTLGALRSATAPTRKYSNITALQRAVRATPDNVYGPDTRKRIDAVRRASRWGGKAFPYGVAYTQGVVGTVVDGIWGANSEAAHDRTVGAIQQAVGAVVDYIWGNETETKVNRLLDGAERP